MMAKDMSGKINVIITRIQALSTKEQTFDRYSTANPHLFTDFMESGEGGCASRGL
jgi:hypothetical protein